MEQVMTTFSAQKSPVHPPPAAATVADLTRPPLTTVSQHDQGSTMPRVSAAKAGVLAGQQRWRWDLNPRKGCPFTRFRELRTTVHHRPQTS
jgi:hypothetical protein